MSPVADASVPASPRGFRARVVRDLFERPAGNFAALDGMRGFASVIVHVYHCGLWSGQFHDDNPVRRALNGFWTGIDIFFVLSGFLIGRILIGELLRDRRIHWAKFWARRSFRILPGYWLVLAGLLLLSAGGIGGAWYYLFGTSDPSVLRRLAWENFAYLNNYLQPSDGASVMSWTWSLCVEEHFYLLLPPLLLAIFRLAPARFRLPLLVGCVLLPLAGRMLQFRADPAIELLGGFYYRSHNRFDEIFVGVVIAYLHVVHGSALAVAVDRLRHLLWPVGFALAAAVWIGGGLHGSGSAFTVVWQFLVMAVGTGFVLLNNLYLHNRVERFFAHPAWYPLSRVSYGSYLLHPFVIFGLVTLGARFGIFPPGVPGFVLFCAVVLVVATLFASLLFVLVERPMLDAGVRVARRLDERRTAG